MKKISNKTIEKKNLLLISLLFILFLSPVVFLFPSSKAEKMEKKLAGASGRERINILVDLSRMNTTDAPQKAITFLTQLTIW